MTGTVENEKYQIVGQGAPNSTDYRIFFETKGGLPVSPLHDIPLYANVDKTTYNMVVEIPRGTNVKMEISLAEDLNPIKQDVKNGKLGFMDHYYSHYGYVWNYGALPQTWLPAYLDPKTGNKRDSKPISVMEIGTHAAKRGDIVQVKILGTFGLVGKGATEWKVITIDVNDHRAASQFHDIDDVKRVFPGLFRSTDHLFEMSQVPNGEQNTQFRLVKSAKFACKLVEETHQFWRTLVNNEMKATGVSCLNTTVEGSPYLLMR